jgi:NAD-dependent SIR2 family protein deacetylase
MIGEGVHILKFQDRVTKKMIGEGVTENGLYILKSQERMYVMTQNKDYKLLHKRLGHLSYKTTNMFLDFLSLKCINCDVCKLA